MKSLDYYMMLPYSVTVAPEECTDRSRCYVARIPELEGCESHGATASEALANLTEAKALYLRSMIEDGIEPPAPQNEHLVATGSGGLTTVWHVDDGSGEGEEVFRMDVPGFEERGVEPAV